MTEGRNLKGSYGRVKIETLPNGDRVLDLDGLKFEIAQAVAEELLAALSSSMRPFAGMSIFEKVMAELDPVIDRMMEGNQEEDGRDPGRAEALCKSLAIIRNPYEPDYTGEKGRAMERYQQRMNQ